MQGYNYEGNEEFWTTAGGNITSIISMNKRSESERKIVCGSDDYMIYTYRDEAVVSEIQETDEIVGLCEMSDSKFGYALKNGTVGIYDGENRVWRQKYKHPVTSIAGFDLDGDGVPELITGLKNGQVEVRSENNGNVIFRETFQSGIAKIINSDYRLEGRDEVIFCSFNGEGTRFMG